MVSDSSLSTVFKGFTMGASMTINEGFSAKE